MNEQKAIVETLNKHIDERDSEKESSFEGIVKAGYANVMTIPPNVKYKDKFLRAYKQARKRKMGLWEE